MALSKGPSCDDYGILFDPEAVKYLKRIIEETGAEIVISSSWKYTYPYQEFLRMWEDRELPGRGGTLSRRSAHCQEQGRISDRLFKEIIQGTVYPPPIFFWGGDCVIFQIYSYL